MISRVLPQTLKCIPKSLGGPVETSRVRYRLKKKTGKKEGEGGKVYTKSLGGVAIFLRSAEDLWGVLGL
jgi:hypothetical protein